MSMRAPSATVMSCCALIMSLPLGSTTAVATFTLSPCKASWAPSAALFLAGMTAAAPAGAVTVSALPAV
ncbi:hypothetical protein D3C81_561010 [compost metagenome]